MNGRDCVSISFHQYAKMNRREAFEGVEKVFQDAGGCPLGQAAGCLSERGRAPGYSTRRSSGR